MESPESRKLRGGYYTPKPIADFITRWVILKGDCSVLEPSCGDGAFIESIISRYIEIGINKNHIPKLLHAVEYDPTEAEKTINRVKNIGIGPLNSHFIVGDFFQYCLSHLSEKIQFDGIVGNPPFIRYQDFPEEQRIPAFALMKRAGLNPNRLTNTWIPFLIASTLLLKEGGRIGMVIPAELFQVNYAAETRAFLSANYTKLFIITFRKLIFPDVQQEVVLLLGEKNGQTKHVINVVEINNMNDLSRIDIGNFKKDIKELNHSAEKWTQYFLTGPEISLLRDIKTNPTISITGESFKVDVGVVTGQNKFFVLTFEDVERYNLSNYVIRIVSRSQQVKGLYISEVDWKKLSNMQNPIYLLNIPDVDYNELPQKVQKYLDIGASQKIQEGYKCRIRKRWWVVPSVWQPDAFMLRQVHSFPKIILNKCKATSTDTVHRVKFTDHIKGEYLAAAFLNSMTLAFSEVTGRSYGGGVLTFEPSEAERLPLPLNNAKKLDFIKTDNYVRNNEIDAVLDMNDAILLYDSGLLTKSEINSLRNMWIKLRDRRINRKYS